MGFKLTANSRLFENSTPPAVLRRELSDRDVFWLFWGSRMFLVVWLWLSEMR